MADSENPGWEAFARGRARGLNMTNAYGEAGYKHSRGAGSRLNKNPLVQMRIAELLIQRDALREARLEETIVALVTLARGADPKNGAALREARAARLEAHRLGGLLTQRRKAETWEPPPPMTEAEWEAKYGPDAPTPSC
jgi:alkylation response protein AidB-like acyl-CoA dehydrogenase